jgi:chromosome segregation ATPase
MAIVEAIKIPIDVSGQEQLNKAGESINNLTKATKNVKDGLTSAQKSMELTGNASGGLKSKLDSVSGNLSKLKTDLSAIPGPVGTVVQGFTGLNTAFKAIIANPIGLLIASIVLALTGLFKILTSTKAGAEKFQQVLDGLGAAIDVVRDRLLKVGSAIVKFFSGDFKGAFSEAKGAVSGLTDEIAREAKEAANLRKELQGIADDERALNIERAKQNTLVAESKLRINDENLSYGERLKALEKVRASEVKLAKQEEELAKRKFEAIKAQNALSDSSQEALNAEANAYIALQAAQRTSLTVQKELFDQEKALRDRQKAEAKAAAEAKKAADKEAETKAEEAFQKWLAIEVAKAETAASNAKFLEDRLAREKAELEAAAAAATAAEEKEFQEWLAIQVERDEIAQANADFAKARKDKEAEEDKARMQAVADLEQEIFDNAQALAAAVISLAGEQSKIGKAVALASIAADTAKALSAALANSQAPTPDNVATGGLAGIAKYIALATTILTNSKRAYDIIKAPAPNTSLSGGGGGAAAAAAAVPRFNAPGVRFGTNEDFTQVRRIYVTERDITNVQDKVRVTEGLSQF